MLGVQVEQVGMGSVRPLEGEREEKMIETNGYLTTILQVETAAVIVSMRDAYFRCRGQGLPRQHMQNPRRKRIHSV